jgi:hypothetical protein
MAGGSANAARAAGNEGDIAGPVGICYQSSSTDGLEVRLLYYSDSPPSITMAEPVM